MTSVAVVTGGAGAIGGAIARRLEEDGHTVVVVDRAAELSCDLGSAEEVRDAARRVLDLHGRCDVLVHAAAAFDRFTIDQFEPDTWRHVQAVNVESLLLLAQAFAPGMRERGFGRIISVVSNTFWSPPSPDLLAYVASKGALVGITRSLAKALGPDGIAAMAVAPGLTRTPGTSAIPEAEFEAVASQQALARPLIPDDVAETVGFLAGRHSAALTGQTLITDGGLVLS
ncbi:SDR family NAD(P)-dependent oxidoreductase [Candidatus Solirubrobacter pratensis]|uniref:SDR family NAD(P)-dependent oxidoreductase n=1 Tax=Candidatus Solirubrobacter pratensis TaxID=1298857 RepID=UPI0004043BB5|nr:SDR family oxidoreductase [Candidatus Solirubrobacter pratensis]